MGECNIVTFDGCLLECYSHSHWSSCRWSVSLIIMSGWPRSHRISVLSNLCVWLLLGLLFLILLELVSIYYVYGDNANNIIYYVYGDNANNIIYYVYGDNVNNIIYYVYGDNVNNIIYYG